MIRVNKNYIIDVDEFNYTVKEDRHKMATRKDKDGNVTEYPVYDTKGYYKTLESALNRIRELMTVKQLEKLELSLPDAINEIRQIEKDFAETFEMVMKNEY